MAEVTRSKKDRQNYQQLLELGYKARADGDKRQAHQYFRHASMLYPDKEEVWWALWEVVDGASDRYQCLQNILAINPQNQDAKRLAKDIRFGKDSIRPEIILRPGWMQRIVRLIFSIAVAAIGVWLIWAFNHAV